MSIDRVSISNQGVERSQSSIAPELVQNTEKDRQTSGGSDSLALSSKAQELNQLANTIEQSRAERFNAVRDALSAGTYQVSGEDIARKLIEANQK